MLVETAGGPNSPGPSGTLQADLYRSLRLPLIFIADWHLGGISTSISAYESLKLRGYDVEGVAVMRDSYYKNFEYFKQYFEERNIPVLTVLTPPEFVKDEDHFAMEHYYSALGSVNDSFSSVPGFLDHLSDQHKARIDQLQQMSSEGLKHIWWPFTQHKGMTAQSIATVDSAYGDYFQTILQSSPASATSEVGSSLLQATLDGSASWWTQGIGHANPDLTMAAAYAAGRYGHVMFASAINQPALSLAKNILSTIKNARLSRVFYSDNGSTGTEVAIKMALTASCKRYGWEPAKDGKEVEILGLKNSYHGDTIGSMDMSEPSVFNEKIHWYKSRGYWFECPSVKMREGKWIVEKPHAVNGELGTDTEFQSLHQVFNQSRDLTDDAAAYETYIRATIEQLTKVEQRRFGALVMEPVVLGAGGMLLVDPLFQRTLANVVRRSELTFAPSSLLPQLDPSDPSWTGLPVVADEVFTGLYRLGHASSSHLVGINPDIAVYAKLLTGGLLPLSCTLASESIFEAFLADGKSEALLHGHSYTAHAVGCNVADTSLNILNKLESDGSWDMFKRDWASGTTTKETVGERIKSAAASLTGLPSQAETDPTPTSSAEPAIWSVWSTAFLTELSHLTDRVDNVWALGSVLSISLKDAGGAGYTSEAAKSLQKHMLEAKGRDWNVHSRVLGNVLYLMTGQTSKLDDVRRWEEVVLEAIKS